MGASGSETLHAVAESADPRVAAVLHVLGGEPAEAAAARFGIETSVLDRWVHSFVEAGSAQVTNRPVGDVARQRDRFLSVFMHGLRTPLAMAQGWADLLDGLDPAPGGITPDRLEPRTTAEVVARLQHSLALVDERALDVELLTAAMLGRLSLDARPVTVGGLARGLGPDAEVGGEGPETVVHVDPALFSRLLRDLWGVARTCAPLPSSVGLEVATTEPWVEIRVLRRGGPILPSVLQALLDPFDVTDDSMRPTVGLYLARALVVVHGGTMGVEQDDDRTDFWVRVPIPAPPPTPSEETP